MLTEQEIEKKVMERFPKDIDERNCATTRRLLQAARDAYRKKLAQMETQAVSIPMKTETNI